MMTDVIHNLSMGFGVALLPINVLFCFVGTLLGTLIGVLPGIGPSATIVLLLPITFSLSPTGGLIMLAGIYYGAQYGGSTTSILVNLPGEAASVVTCLDGHAMARQGRAGPALFMAAVGSFIAGCFGTLVIAFFAPPLTEVALEFGPAEYCSLMVLGLVSAVALAQGSLLKAFQMVFLGLLLGLVGTDVTSGMERYTFGLPDIYEGFSFVSIGMGLLGYAQIVANLERTTKREVIIEDVKGWMPTRDDVRSSWKAILRGSVLGSILGLLPGGGAVISSFGSYALEKRLAADPSRFGKGAIEGVAGPESANNAGSQTSFIPMLTLGIPTNTVMALMLGAMMVWGIAPGPEVMSKQPQMFWGLIASMWLGNLMLLVLNLPLIGIWIRLLKLPYRLLYPLILLLCCIGVYSMNRNTADILIMAGFGLLGYIFNKLDCEPAPLLLGFILGPLFEENLRRAMLLSRGDPSVFLTQPISLALLLAAGLLLILVTLPKVSRTRDVAFRE